MEFIFGFALGGQCPQMMMIDGGMAVKANYIGNKSDYNKLAMQVAREEVERQKADVCPACEKSIGNQVLAITLKALQIRYGFGKKRMEVIVQDVENLFLLCAVDGKRFNAFQAVEWLRDAMGIDLNKGE